MLFLPHNAGSEGLESACHYKFSSPEESQTALHKSRAPGTCRQRGSTAATIAPSPGAQRAASGRARGQGSAAKAKVQSWGNRRRTWLCFSALLEQLGNRSRCPAAPGRAAVKLPSH